MCLGLLIAVHLHDFIVNARICSMAFCKTLSMVRQKLRMSQDWSALCWQDVPDMALVFRGHDILGQLAQSSTACHLVCLVIARTPGPRIRHSSSFGQGGHHKIVRGPLSGSIIHVNSTARYYTTEGSKIGAITEILRILI